MASVIVPFRGSAAKQRLAQLPETLRGELARAMLEDVLAAAREVGRTLLVAPERIPGAELVPDPGRGQGAAVEAGLAAAGEGPVLIVNSDLPCATSRDLFTLLIAPPPLHVALADPPDWNQRA